MGALRDRDAEKILPYEDNDSPFPEVRAVIQPVNDLTLPVSTIRMWTIGIVFTIVCSIRPAIGEDTDSGYRSGVVSINSSGKL